jgi:hypothetical protein
VYFEKKLMHKKFCTFFYWIFTSRFNQARDLKILDSIQVFFYSLSRFFILKRTKDRFYLLEVFSSLGSLLKLRAIQCIFLELGLELVFKNYGHFQWKRVLGYFLVSGALSNILE